MERAQISYNAFGATLKRELCGCAMRYFVYMNAKVLGPVEKEKLRELPNFSPKTLICVEREGEGRSKAWTMAGTVAELSSFFAAVPGAAQPVAAKDYDPSQTARVLHDQIDKLNSLLDNLNSPAPGEVPAPVETEKTPTSEIMKNLSALAKELPAAEKNAAAAQSQPAAAGAPEAKPVAQNEPAAAETFAPVPQTAVVPKPETGTASAVDGSFAVIPLKPAASTQGEQQPAARNKARAAKPVSKDKTSKAGLPEGWSRATFIVKEEYLEKLKDYSYWERLTLKEAMDGILAQFFNGREVRPRRKH